MREMNVRKEVKERGWNDSFRGIGKRAKGILIKASLRGRKEWIGC